MLELNLDAELLRPMVKQIVATVLAELDGDESKLGDRIAFSEPEAAALIGLKPHQLRDERLRGRIGASCVVKRGIRYLRSDLMTYLARERSEPRI